MSKDTKRTSEQTDAERIVDALKALLDVESHPLREAKTSAEQTDVPNIVDGLKMLLALMDVLTEQRTVDKRSVSVLLGQIAVCIESGLPGYVDIRS